MIRELTPHVWFGLDPKQIKNYGCKYEIEVGETWPRMRKCGRPATDAVICPTASISPPTVMALWTVCAEHLEAYKTDWAPAEPLRVWTL